MNCFSLKIGPPSPSLCGREKPNFSKYPLANPEGRHITNALLLFVIFLSPTLLEPLPASILLPHSPFKMLVRLCANLKKVWLFPYCQQLLNKIYVTVVTHAWVIFGSNSPRRPLTQGSMLSSSASLILASV